MYSSRKGPDDNSGKPLIKLGGPKRTPYYGDGKIYIFHNTSLIPGAETGLSGHSTQINADTRYLRNCVTRNNVFESASDAHSVICNLKEDPENDFDYDLYNGYIHWGAHIFELNGIQGYPMCTGRVDFYPEEIRNNGTGNFYQTAASPGVDAGIPIANFNDGFTGDAPDMGAHKTGTPLMRFGVTASYQTPHGLVGLWPFDEKQNLATAIDKSGHGNTGVINGNVLRRKGRHFRALRFDGNSDYVEIVDPGESALDITQDLSIALWVKRTEVTPGEPSGDQWFLSKPGAYDWKFSSDKAYLYLYMLDKVILIESSPPPANTWHHLAAVYDYSGQQVRIYIDGEPQEVQIYIDGVLSTDQLVTGEIATTDDSLFLGHPSDAGLIGELDDVHFYKRVLTDDEILQLAGITKDTSLVAHYDFEEGPGDTITDVSGNGNTGYVYGTASWSPGRSGTGLEFDITEINENLEGDCAEIPDSSGDLSINGDFSLALWIKRKPGSLGDEWFLRKPGTYAWKIESNKPHFLIYSPGLNVVSPSSLELGPWYHLVAIYNQSTQIVSIYIDGELDTTAAVGAPLNLTSDDHILGHSGDACFNGTLDDVRIYNKVLSLSEIQAIYNANLVGHWPLDDGMGIIATDTSGNGNDGTLEGNIAWGEGKLDQAVEFSGPDDKVKIKDTSGDLDITGDLTISLWLKRFENFAGDEWFLLKDSAYAWKLNGGIPYFYIWAPDMTIIAPKPETTIPPDGSWHHIAAVYDASEAEVSIYIDGVLNITQTVDGELSSTQSDIIIGTDTDAVLKGMIDDVRIFNIALGADEIARLFQGE